MKWLHIHIRGMVQGVGFRPFVYKLAHWLKLHGWVSNGTDGVHIEIGGDTQQLEMFQYLLKDDAPDEAKITTLDTIEINPLAVDDFKIVESTTNLKTDLLITPDLALCDACRYDIKSLDNRRYHYPFTTCTHCGPRYSIIKSLPYDRKNTSMKMFAVCKSCEQEYHDVFSARHYSQTNSCPECTIPLRLIDRSGKILSSSWDSALEIIIQRLNAGEIIAVKGIGGYLLMTDATNARAIKELRKRKHRPAKPFAVMYPCLEMLKADAKVTDVIAKNFNSIQAPIVLVQINNETKTGICLDEIAPGIDRVGAMKPYTALFELLMDKWQKPLIATSANLSSSPIVYQDHQALEILNEIADLFLIHDREILIPEDDSVVAFSALGKHMIRRSRGFAPTYLNTSFVHNDDCILSMGADMKSAFAIQTHGRIYVSQYLGDLESFESQESFRHTLNHLINLLQVKPQKVIVDAHPNYFSSQLGRQLAALWNIPVEEVFHHQAHAWSVLVENDLINQKEPVLCIIWDGTGYGDDLQIWGGEFYKYADKKLERVSHLTYTPAWQGDLMAREPRLSALFMLREFEEQQWLREKFTATEWTYYQKLIDSRPTIYSSSMGRLFDAVASILDVCDKNSFEGEAAMLLEVIARKEQTMEQYEIGWVNNNLDINYLLTQVIRDIMLDKPKALIAFKFHLFLADVIYDVALQQDIKHIALSGGVFQNMLLQDLIAQRTPTGFVIYTNKELAANDENIALGQLACTSVRSSRAQMSEYVENL